MSIDKQKPSLSVSQVIDMRLVFLYFITTLIISYLYLHLYYRDLNFAVGPVQESDAIHAKPKELSKIFKVI